MIYELATVQSFVDQWIADWNAHDLSRIISHYHPQIRFSSPIIRQLGINSTGCIDNKASLRAYFERALGVYPDLHFTWRQTLIGCDALLIYYDSVQQRQAVERMVVDESGLIRLVEVHYSA